MYLRTWIRENYQHDHNISYTGIRSLKGCYGWGERVIRAEFQYSDARFTESFMQYLQQNRDIFYY